MHARTGWHGKSWLGAAVTLVATAFTLHWLLGRARAHKPQE